MANRLHDLSIIRVHQDEVPHLDFSSEKIPLPTYITCLDEGIRMTVLEAWRIEIPRFFADLERSVLVFCHPDGSKSITCKLGSEVALLFARSKVYDEQYGRVIAALSGLSLDSLEVEFSKLPNLDDDLVDQLVEEIQETFDDLRDIKQVRQELLEVSAVYNSVDEFGREPYGVDIRLFSLLQAFRSLVVDVNVTVLSLPSEDSLSNIGRLYVYNTTDLPPTKAPIFAFSKARLIAAQLKNLKSDWDLDRIVENSVDGERPVDLLLSFGTDERCSKHLQRWTAVVETEFTNGPVLIEVSGDSLSRMVCKMIVESLMVAYDPGFDSAISLLDDRVSIHSIEQKTELVKFAQIFNLGFTNLSGREIGKICAWASNLKLFLDIVGPLSVGCLFPDAEEKLSDIINCLNVSSEEEAGQKENLMKKLAADLENMIVNHALRVS